MKTEIGHIPNWFISKLPSDEKYLWSVGDFRIIKETEKAVNVEIETDFGKLWSWIPKSILNNQKYIEQEEANEANEAKRAEAMVIAFENHPKFIAYAKEIGIKNVRSNSKISTTVAKMTASQINTAIEIGILNKKYAPIVVEVVEEEIVVTETIVIVEEITITEKAVKITKVKNDFYNDVLNNDFYFQNEPIKIQKYFTKEELEERTVCQYAGLEYVYIVTDFNYLLRFEDIEEAQKFLNNELHFEFVPVSLSNWECWKTLGLQVS